MTIEIYIDQYNARLFPLRKRVKLNDPECKRPLREDWPNSNYTKKEILDFAAAGHPIGWALSEEDLIVDVDVASEERPDKQGAESLAKLERAVANLEEGACVVVQSPKGGRHFYFTKPAALALRKSHNDYPGLDFLSKGSYVVIAGSPHWQGGVYEFNDRTVMFDDYERPAAPQSLLDLLAKDVTEIDPEQELVTVEASTLEQMLQELDPVEYRDHETWFRIMAACHSATGGSVEGMQVFIDWSISDPQYQHAGDEIAHRWKTLRERQDGVTIGTLFEQLKLAGRSDVVRKVRAQLDFHGVSLPVELPEIDYGLDESRVNDQIIHALGRAKNLFQRAGSLVTIADTHINPINPLTLCETVSSVCRLMKTGDEGPQPIRVPERVGRQLVGRGAWFGIPTLRAIVTTPVFTASGLLQQSGYDVRSGVYLKRTIEVEPIPENPSKTDALVALNHLKDLVSDFPFLSASHRSNWLAALLTLLARHAIDGPVPLFLVDGNQAGVGKTLLVNLATTIAFGQSVYSGALSDENEEVAKTLLSIARQGYGAYCFDNLKNGADFGCAALDQVLTGRSISGRVLGQSLVADAEISCVFFATGNRVGISKESDSFRRVAIVSLQSKSEDPKSRTEFKFGCDSHLLNYAMANRSGLIRDCLTILQAARMATDLPSVSGWGSYSAFSELIRRPLVWLGEPDPIESRNDVVIHNEDADELSAIIHGMLSVFGQGEYRTAGEIYSVLRNSGDEFAAAADALAPDSFREPSKAAAKRLKTRFRDRPCDGYWVKSKKCLNLNQMVYGVEKL